MKVFYGQLPHDGCLTRPKVTLGTFDGVHLGHQRVLRDLVAWARSTNSDAVVITFDRKPRDMLSNSPTDFITSLPHRLKWFERLGMDAVLVLTFEPRLAAMSPEAFVREIIVGSLGASGVLLGHDTRFGRAGLGDLGLLDAMGRTLGFEVCSTAVVTMDGAPVSSTRIREAIHAGNLAVAERLMGRRVRVLGTVVPGRAIGKTIGFPTANLDLHHEVRLPEGVYATQTLIDGSWRNSVTNIGRVPTLRAGASAVASDTVVVETHVLDFSGDLYGRELELRFVAFLRPEKTFPSAQALAAQIELDVIEARRQLAQTDQCEMEEPA